MTPILLRPWASEDARALVSIYVSSPDLSRQFPYPVTDPTRARELIGSGFGCDDSRRQWAIVVDGLPVGHVAITAIERRHHTGWVSYFSAGFVRGKGFVTRAVTAAANHALADLGLFRLELGHRTNNPASAAVAIAAGFVHEGTERQKLEYDGERFDVHTYGRLATDPFPAVQQVELLGV